MIKCDNLIVYINLINSNGHRDYRDSTSNGKLKQDVWIPKYSKYANHTYSIHETIRVSVLVLVLVDLTVYPVCLDVKLPRASLLKVT